MDPRSRQNQLLSCQSWWIGFRQKVLLTFCLFQFLFCPRWNHCIHWCRECLWMNGDECSGSADCSGRNFFLCLHFLLYSIHLLTWSYYRKFRISRRCWPLVWLVRKRAFPRFSDHYNIHREENRPRVLLIPWNLWLQPRQLYVVRGPSCIVFREIRPRCISGWLTKLCLSSSFRRYSNWFLDFQLLSFLQIACPDHFFVCPKWLDL